MLPFQFWKSSCPPPLIVPVTTRSSVTLNFDPSLEVIFSGSIGADFRLTSKSLG